jgi:methylated-DNA-[protein]-cysteine S-methyltransferase
MTYTRFMDTPIGTLLIESNEDAIAFIGLPRADPRLKPPPPAHLVDEPPVLSEAVSQLTEYFAGTRTQFSLPLSLAGGTDFQRQVWTALAEIPYGKTVSYAELANMVGRPNAFRAVGQANGANPIPIVLPCHRVVASGGGIGGYGGGLDMKRRLLALEGSADVS